MSRIGKKPVIIPGTIDVSIDGSRIVFKNSKHKKELETYGRVNVSIRGSELVFELLDESLKSKAFWGTYRALANNVVVGLSSGFTKVLEINGVGYRASVNGKSLELALGYSHPVIYNIPSEVDISVDKNQVKITGVDKQVVGQVAADIRGFRPPEPYKGKGIKYVDEIIIRKAGKTSKK